MLLVEADKSLAVQPTQTQPSYITLPLMRCKYGAINERDLPAMFLRLEFPHKRWRSAGFKELSHCV